MGKYQMKGHIFEQVSWTTAEVQNRDSPGASRSKNPRCMGTSYYSRLNYGKVQATVSLFGLGATFWSVFHKNSSQFFFLT